MLDKKVPMPNFPDSKQVFNVIIHCKRPTEGRLGIDTKNVRERYYRFEIVRVRLMSGENNLYDTLRESSHKAGPRRLLT